MDPQQCKANGGKIDGDKCLPARRKSESKTSNRTTFWVSLLASVVASVIFLLLVHYTISYAYPEPQYPSRDCDKLDPAECQVPPAEFEEYEKALERRNTVVFYIYAVISLLAIGLALTFTNVAIITSGLLVGIASVAIGLTGVYKSGLHVIITLAMLLVFIGLFIWKYQRKNFTV